MTRQEWILHYRRIRVEQPKTTISSVDMTNVIREFYEYLYTPEQLVFIKLVRRYKDKLSSSYLDKVESFKPEAKERAERVMKDLVYRTNPFLSLLPKGIDSWQGKYVPVPIKNKA